MNNEIREIKNSWRRNSNWTRDDAAEAPDSHSPGENEERMPAGVLVLVMTRVKQNQDTCDGVKQNHDTASDAKLSSSASYLEKSLKHLCPSCTPVSLNRGSFCLSFISPGLTDKFRQFSITLRETWGENYLRETEKNLVRCRYSYSKCQQRNNYQNLNWKCIVCIILLN